MDLSVKSNAAKSMNKTALTGNTIMFLVMLIAYLIEFLKGSRDVVSFGIIAIMCVLPVLLSVIVYLRKADSLAIRYIVGVGFIILYTYIMLTTTTDLVFCYAIVAFVGLMVFIDMKLLYILGIYSIILNAVRIVMLFTQGKLKDEVLTNAEIIIACLILTVTFIIMAIKKMNQINQANVDKADAEKEQSEVLLQKTLEVASSMTENIAEAVSETVSLNDAISSTQNEMENVVEDVNMSVEAIAVQKQNTEKINTYIQGVETSVQSITEEVQSAEDNLNASDKVMKDLLEQVKLSEESNALVAEKMAGLKEYADKMQDIMGLISSIAHQTGLLALNASIEAARAGEAGKGFSVVASEISNLSAQTNNATGDINELIENIVDSISDMTQSVEQMIEGSRLQNQYVDETAESFDKIRQSTQSIVGQVSNLKETVDVVMEENKQIEEGIDNVFSVTQKVMSGANETLSVCNTNLQSIAHVTEIMDTLTQDAAKLQNE